MNQIFERVKEYKFEILKAALILMGLCFYLLYIVVVHMNYSSQDLAFWQMYTWRMGLVLIAAIFLVYVLLHIKKISEEWIFVVICLVFGVVYSFVSPPRGLPDEPAHYYTAYRYSNLIMGKGYGVGEKYIPMREEEKKFDEYAYEYSQYDYRVLVSRFFQMEETDVETMQSADDVGNALLYIPQTMGVLFGRLLHFGFTPTYYMARFFNLFVYIFITFFAIRRIPIGKNVLVLLATLPISLQQAASVSYDTSIIACSFYLISMFLYLIIGDGRMTRKLFLLICAASVLVGSSKYGVYLPVLLLWFFIPKEKFSGTWSKKKLTFIGGGIIIAAMILVALPNYLPLLAKDAAGAAVTATKQAYTIGNIINDPLFFCFMILNTLHAQGGTIFLDGIGYSMSWLDKIVPIYLPIAFFVLLLLASVRVSKEKKEISKKLKLCFIGIFVLTGTAFMAAAFTWTFVGTNVINGIQGRYFLPVVLLIYLLINTKQLTFQKDYSKYFLFLSVIGHFVFVMQMLLLTLV